MNQRNCHARTTQKRQRMAQKATMRTARGVLAVQANQTRKPPAHVWRRGSLYFTETLQPVSPFDLYGGWHW